MEQYFITAKVEKIDKDIELAIQRANIVFPHPFLKFFKAKYALADSKTPNLNSVVLEKSTQEDVPLLVGTQVNRDHLSWQRLGFVLNAFMVEDEIQIIIAFDTTYNKKEYDEAVKLMDKGKLHVSFELMVESANVRKEGNIKYISHASFCGCGLLFGVKPAYPDGNVIERALEIINNAMDSDNKQLIYANVESISKKWLALGEKIEQAINESKLSDKTGGNIMDKKSNDALLAAQKQSVINEFGSEATKNWTDEDYLDENKIIALRESLKSAENKEVKAEEIKEVKSEDKASEVKAETKKEDATVVNEKTTETRVYDVKRDDATGTMEVVETVTTQKEVDGKVVMDEKVVRNTVYASEKVDAMKADYEAKLAEKDTVIASKDAEIKTKSDALTAKEEEIKFVKENAKKITEIRAELGDFVKDLSDEDLVKNSDKVEIARLKKENAELKATKAPEKPVETATAKKEVLTAKDTNAVNDDETEDDILEAHLKEKNKKANKK
jgi:hypothetical protein